MQAISDNLIHFLGRQFKDDPEQQLKIFELILENGLKCSYIDTHFGPMGKVWTEAVCFTDIPLNFCSEHTANYGKFGIGFKKSFIKNLGGNPAWYFVNHYPVPEPPEGAVIEKRGQIYRHLCQAFHEHVKLAGMLKNQNFGGFYDQDGTLLIDREKLETYSSLMHILFSFTKPMGDLGLPKDDSEDIDPYYKEREWKLIPFKVAVDNKKIIEKDNTRYILFERRDIRIIIVPDNSVKNKLTKHLLSLKEPPRLKSFADDLPPIFIYDDLKYL